MNHVGNSPIESVLADIPRDDCLALLQTQSVGRLAVADHGYYPPHIVPVNFVVDGEAILFRSNAGLKFRLAVLAEHSVSFEVDCIDPSGALTWSVVDQGRAELLTPEQVDPLPVASWLHPWAPGQRDEWIRIVPYTITGRRLELAPVAPPTGESP